MSGEKVGEKIYEALLGCVHRNTADSEYLNVMSYLIHKLVWELTASNEKADQVIDLVSAGKPVEVDDKEIEDYTPDAE